MHWRPMSTALWSARLVLAVVFGAAAIGKVRDRAGTVASARDLGVPGHAVAAVASLLPIAEATAALLIVFPSTSRIGAAIALVLLGAFSVAIATTLRAGRTPTCHCFGVRSNRPIGSDTLVRNSALMLLGIVVLAGTR